MGRPRRAGNRQFSHGMDRAGAGEVDWTIISPPSASVLPRRMSMARSTISFVTSESKPTMLRTAVSVSILIVSYLSGNCPFVVMSRDMMPHMFLNINGVC